MQLNKIMLAAVLAFGASSMAHADAGHGKITFTGSIIDAACSVAPESEDQTVPLGQIAKSQLALNGNTGKSTPRNFEIKLENCDTATANQVTVTYTGTPSSYDADSLGITGTASGASVVMTDGSGTKIKLGQATAPRPIQNGTNNLVFSAYVQGGGASATITEGEFQSVTDFTLAYL